MSTKAKMIVSSTLVSLPAIKSSFIPRVKVLLEYVGNIIILWHILIQNNKIINITFAMGIDLVIVLDKYTPRMDLRWIHLLK
uniref:Uncharacterized protein n=1 Tax=Oryza nivara TaxID=4536 RepID=A0A0E0IGV4_ORYNI